MNTLARLDSTSNRHNHPKYRYSTPGRVEYRTTIRPPIRPRVLAEYRIFFEYEARSSYSLKLENN